MNCSRSRLRRQITSFVRDEDGSIIIFGFVLLSMLFTAGGLAVDVLNYEAQRAKLQSTLDRAVLAAASVSQPLDPNAVILDYFEKAGLSSTIESDDVKVSQTSSFRRVYAEASLDIDTMFLGILGIDSLQATASAAAEESVSLTEISLVLDVSGSMWSYGESGNRKLKDLKDAATQFVNIMQCDPENPSNTTNCSVDPEQVSISIVPYAEQVLVGETLLSQFNATSEHNDSACVTFDAADFETTAINTTDQIQRTGHFDGWSSSSRAPSSWVCDTDSWREVVPVSFDSDALRTAISNLDADGSTSSDVGMKWGVALLDPAAQPAISGLISSNALDSASEGRPYDWSKRGLSKVIVLMTDGENTSQFYLNDAVRSGPSPVWYNATANRYSIYDKGTGNYYWDNGWSSSWQDHAYGEGTYRHCSYWTGCSMRDEPGTSVQLTYQELWRQRTTSWFDRFTWVPSPDGYVRHWEKDDRLQKICDAAKDKGVVIFAIGFEVSASSGQVLRDCATSYAHYFDVEGLELTTAFHSVAREISKLRLLQ